MFTTLKFKKSLNIAGRKVGLIIPPSPFLVDERVFVSLGILRVGASLESQGVNVGILDLSGVSNFLDALEKYLELNTVEWLGITCTTPQLPSVITISKVIRKNKPNIKIVLGGPHVTLTYSAVKIEKKLNRVGRATKAAEYLESHFDVLVPGDGELAVFKLFEKNNPKVIDGDNMRDEFFMTDEQYNSSEFPARHLIDLSSYHYSIDKFPATSLIAQLGCPFNCGFCGGRNSRSLRVIRSRTDESVIEEMRQLYIKYGYTGFMFYDDELNVNKTFVSLLKKITNLQKELSVEFRLRGFIKAELFTEEQAEAMYNAGFRWVLSGFEAAHSKILTNIDKIATLEDNTNVIKIAHKYGLKVKALMSIGHPGESKETVLAIKDWLIKMEVDDFDCTIITTYPGTPYYDFAVPHDTEPNVWTYTHKKTGDRLHSYDVDYTTVSDYYKGNPNGGYTSFVFTDFLTPTELVELRNEIETDVRKILNIPLNLNSTSLKFEHSMGQGLPEIIYKESKLISP